MQLNAAVFWFVLSISMVHLLTSAQARHVHTSVKFPAMETASPDTMALSSKQPPDPTVPPEELENLFNWFDVPNTAADRTSVPTVTDDKHQEAQSSDVLDNNTSGSPIMDTETEAGVLNGHTSNRLLNTNQQLPVTTAIDPTFGELFEVLQNLTKPSNAPADKDNDSFVLQNVTTMSELLDNMDRLQLENLQDLRNITSSGNDSLIQNLLNATEVANINTLDELRNLTSTTEADDIEDFISGLHNISYVNWSSRRNGTGSEQLESLLMNITGVNTSLDGLLAALEKGNVTGNLTEEGGHGQLNRGNGTGSWPEFNETGLPLVNITEGEDGFMVPNTTTEISRLETATNDELWPPTEGATTKAGSSAPVTTERTITNEVTTEKKEPITNEEATASSTTSQSATTSPATSQSASTEPEAANSNDNLLEPVVKSHNWNNPYFGGLVTALVFGCLFVLILVAFVGKRLYDGYQRRNYTKMDYLVNGMYN